MNLDDFSYEENGRRYIDPNVSLNEQNAFIQNLRDTQVQRNDQIAQQTHNLGTDVPSNLGGLNGSEAYFNSRYQTPQTNSLVGNLKAAAQAQALSTALNNELQKAQKRYNDAYYAAKDRERNANNTTTSGDGDTLTINTDTGENKIYEDVQNHQKGDIYVGEDGKTRLDTGDGHSTIIRTPNAAEYAQNAGIFDTSHPNEGEIIGRNGKQFIYTNGEWYVIVGTE